MFLTSTYLRLQMGVKDWRTQCLEHVHYCNKEKCISTNRLLILVVKHCPNASALQRVPCGSVKSPFTR